MNSIIYQQELNSLKERIIQECRQTLESMALEKYPIEHGFKQIVLTFPLWDQVLGTPIYVNSCFQGEDNIYIRKISCSPEGLGVGCHYIGEGHTWKADIAEECMHERDMINILELIEKMKCLGIVYEHLHVRL